MRMGLYYYGTHPWKRAEGSNCRRFLCSLCPKGFRGLRDLGGQTEDEHGNSDGAFPESGDTDFRSRQRPQAADRFQQASAIRVDLPANLPGQHAYVLKLPRRCPKERSGVTADSPSPRRFRRQCSDPPADDIARRVDPIKRFRLN
jgi:hypothetical protein